MTHPNSITLWRSLRQLPATAAIAAISIAGCGSPANADTASEFIHLESPAAPGSLGPHLSVTPDGKAVLSWLEPAEGEAHAVRFSVLEDDAWTSPVSVAEGADWFVNWADFPSVVPITAEQWTAHWLAKRPGGTYSYDIALSVSSDRGESWAAPLTPHTDGTPTEHGFVTIFPWSDGIGVVWLDGRNMVPDASGETRSEDKREYGGMTLRFGRFGYDGKELDAGEIDELVCDCCQTDAALTTSGPIVAYRDRSTGEIRDISVARHVDGAWTEPVTISDDNWFIPACPVNGPTIAVNGKLVVVAWYGAPERQSRVKLAWSQDAGQTFAAPVVIDDGQDGGRVHGRVDVELLSDGSAVVSWVGQTPDGVGQARMRQLTTDGDAGPVQVITEGNFSRGTGFPQMVRAGNRLVYAWPEAGEPKRIHTAYTSL